MLSKEEIKEYFQKSAAQRLRRKSRNRYYHSQIEKYYSFFIPEKSRVIEIGCGTGELLNAVKPEYGVGIDFSANMIEIAKKNFPNLVFDVQDAENLEIKERFDYIILSDLIGS